jgi:hypothetical protein
MKSKKDWGKCKHCGDDLAQFWEKDKRDKFGFSGCKSYRQSVKAGCCPSCYRIHLRAEDMTKVYFKCPKCGAKGEQTSFFPGSLCGGDEYSVVCPKCTKPGSKAVFCKQVKRL